jgi:hypothetical protein
VGRRAGNGFGAGALSVVYACRAGGDRRDLGDEDDGGVLAGLAAA